MFIKGKCGGAAAGCRYSHSPSDDVVRKPKAILPSAVCSTSGGDSEVETDAVSTVSSYTSPSNTSSTASSCFAEDDVDRTLEMPSCLPEKQMRMVVKNTFLDFEAEGPVAGRWRSHSVSW